MVYEQHKGWVSVWTDIGSFNGGVLGERNAEDLDLLYLRFYL